MVINDLYHIFIIVKFILFVIHHFYQRNPDEDKNGPWCFTVGGSWERCKIVSCQKYYKLND